jgi:hypothetical protein
MLLSKQRQKTAPEESRDSPNWSGLHGTVKPGQSSVFPTSAVQRDTPVHRKNTWSEPTTSSALLAGRKRGTHQQHRTQVAPLSGRFPRLFVAGLRLRLGLVQFTHARVEQMRSQSQDTLLLEHSAVVLLIAVGHVNGYRESAACANQQSAGGRAGAARATLRPVCDVLNSAEMVRAASLPQTQ